MTQPSDRGRSTRVSQIIHAPREAVFRAFLEPDALAAWLPPEGMRGDVHTLEPREGGMFRLSLTYLNPQNSPPGKTSDDTDTVEGQFIELIPNAKIVWVTKFESDQPGFAGEMRITWSLADADGGTEVTVLCEGIPAGIRLEDNELGSKQSLQKLAAFIKRGTNGGTPP
jgi:uncharacterized protein YndB with AHSA1/START domain